MLRCRSLYENEVMFLFLGSYFVCFKVCSYYDVLDDIMLRVNNLSKILHMYEVDESGYISRIIGSNLCILYFFSNMSASTNILICFLEIYWMLLFFSGSIEGHCSGA
jgi:hypothetical protein